MLLIHHVSSSEDALWDEVNEVFVQGKSFDLRLEHSLVSLSKWESIWKIPMLSKRTKMTDEMFKSYIECMSLTGPIDRTLIESLTREELDKIAKYIGESFTATTFSKSTGRGGTGEEITSELIYYWLVALQIPFEVQKWNLSRAMTLIQICNIKNQPSKKMSKRQTMSRNAALNRARRARTGSTG